MGIGLTSVSPYGLCRVFGVGMPPLYFLGVGPDAKSVRQPLLQGDIGTTSDIAERKMAVACRFHPAVLLVWVSFALNVLNGWRCPFSPMLFPRRDVICALSSGGRRHHRLRGIPKRPRGGLWLSRTSPSHVEKGSGRNHTRSALANCKRKWRGMFDSSSQQSPSLA